MIPVTDLRAGAVFEQDGQLWQVIHYEHIKMGRGSATIKVKVKNVRSGTMTEKSFISGNKVEEAQLEHRKVQYLYKNGDEFIFMDNSNFEQLPLKVSQLGGQEKFLKEGIEGDLLAYENQPLGLDLPRSLNFKVSETGPSVKGNSVSNIYKPATLENGLTVSVPLFINEGDRIKIDTRTGEYVERIR
ncbi:MAG: elongation factor P [Patescibacteria group bacterium]|nr:elongation factor P [Patescibacteria group bacterium]